MNYLQLIKDYLFELFDSVRKQEGFVSGTVVTNTPIMILSSFGKIDTILESDNKVKECTNTWIGSIRFQLATNSSAIDKQGEILENLLMDLKAFENQTFTSENYDVDLYSVELLQHSSAVSNGKNECTFDVMILTQFNLKDN